jgi:hypothetical protein
MLMMHVQYKAEKCSYKKYKGLSWATVIFTSLRLLNFDTQEGV